MNVSGGGWMWPPVTADPVFVADVALWSISSLLPSMQRFQECHEVGDIAWSQPIGLHIRHDAHRAVGAVLEDPRDVLGRRFLAVDQIGMRRIVEQPGQAWPDLALRERGGVVAHRAFRVEKGLAGSCVAACEIDRGSRSGRSMLLCRIPAIEVRLG